MLCVIGMLNVCMIALLDYSCYLQQNFVQILIINMLLFHITAIYLIIPVLAKAANELTAATSEQHT